MKDFKGFRFDSRLARGGMASVYRGTQLSLDRAVAIKELYPHLAEDEQYISRFEREAKVLATFSSENIVGILDYGQQDGSYYIVMEFIDGFSLKKLIHNSGRLPLNQAITIAEMMAKGLKYAHNKGVIHRDIKPENILLSRDGVVKIADFGLTRSLDGTHLTVTGTVMGTPAYMSPEQARGDKVDGRTDIYAWGVTLYEMLSGEKAYSGDTYSAVLSKLLTEPPRPLSEVCPDIPRKIVELVEGCLAKKPEDRPQSFEEVVNQINVIRRKYDELAYPIDLKEFIDHHSEENQVEVRVERLERSAGRKNKSLMQTVVVSAVILLLFTVGYFVLKEQKKPEQGYIAIKSEPSGASISFNGEVLDVVTPAVVPADSGDGVFAIFSDSSETLQIEYAISETGTLRYELTLQFPEKNIDTLEKEVNTTNVRRPKAGSQTQSVVKNSKPGFLTVPGLPGEPFFYVFVDGKHIGETPLSEIELSSGSHLLELSRNKLGTELVMRKNLTVRSEKAISIKPEIQSTGKLNVNSNPWGYVYIDGRRYSEVPLVIDLPEGNYSVRVENPSGKAAQQSVVIEKGKTEKLSFTLQ